LGECGEPAVPGVARQIFPREPRDSGSH
jgi:hypothetical protein